MVYEERRIITSSVGVVRHLFAIQGSIYFILLAVLSINIYIDILVCCTLDRRLHYLSGVHCAYVDITAVEERFRKHYTFDIHPRFLMDRSDLAASASSARIVPHRMFHGGYRNAS